LENLTFVTIALGTTVTHYHCRNQKISSFFHTITAQLLSLSITADIHNSLLLHPHRPEVMDFIKFLNCLGSLLMDQISQNVKPGMIIFPKIVQQQYTGEVDMSIIIMLQISSVYCMPNIIEIINICRNYDNVNMWTFFGTRCIG